MKKHKSDPRQWGDATKLVRGGLHRTDQRAGRGQEGQTAYRPAQGVVQAVAAQHVFQVDVGGLADLRQARQRHVFLAEHALDARLRHSKLSRQSGVGDG